MIERQKLNLELAQKYVQALPNQEHTQLLTTKNLPNQSKYYTFRFGEGDNDPDRPMGVPIASYRGDDGELYVTQTRYNHHSIVTASSGLGKTQGDILNCAFNLNPNMSYVFADPKGEIAKFSYSRLCEIYGKENVLIANFLAPESSMIFFNLFTDLAHKWVSRTKRCVITLMSALLN